MKRINLLNGDIQIDYLLGSRIGITEIDKLEINISTIQIHDMIRNHRNTFVVLINEELIDAIKDRVYDETKIHCQSNFIKNTTLLDKLKLLLLNK